jgi:ribosomal protein S18 acetylase RimI-like enzyme
MATNVEIKPALPADRKAVLELLIGQYEEHRIPVVREKLEQAILGVLEEPERGVLLLAWLGGAAVGVAYISFVWSLEHGGHSCWLDELYVRPEHRNQGLGEQLLRVVLEAARLDGCIAVDLEVEASQDRASHLYERFGFRAHSRRRYVFKLRAPAR